MNSRQQAIARIRSFFEPSTQHYLKLLHLVPRQLVPVESR